MKIETINILGKKSEFSKIVKLSKENVLLQPT